MWRGALPPSGPEASGEPGSGVTNRVGVQEAEDMARALWEPLVFSLYTEDTSITLTENQHAQDPVSMDRRPKEAERKQAFISPSQTRILAQAFERDRFPGVPHAEELARQAGLPEPRVQIVQSQRARHLEQSGGGPGKAEAEALSAR
nr:double homeobox protein 4C-like [Vicugna pacos]